jgi:hypothetical protein
MDAVFGITCFVLIWFLVLSFLSLVFDDDEGLELVEMVLRFIFCPVTFIVENIKEKRKEHKKEEARQRNKNIKNKEFLNKEIKKANMG